ncbi:MAG: hypothetical protein WBH73_08815 [Arcanobacterium sp.]
MKILENTKARIVATVVALAVIVGGIWFAVSGGDDTEAREALRAEYVAYTATMDEIDARMDELSPRVEGCLVDIGEATVGHLCADLQEAFDGVDVTLLDVKVDDVESADLDSTLTQVKTAHGEAKNQLAALNAAYDAIDGTFDIQRQVFMGEVDQRLEWANNTLDDAQAALDGAEGSGVDGGMIDAVSAGIDELSPLVADIEERYEDLWRSTDGEAVQTMFDSQITLRSALDTLNNAVATGASTTPQALDPSSVPATSGTSGGYSGGSTGGSYQAPSGGYSPSSSNTGGSSYQSPAPSTPSTGGNSGGTGGGWVVVEERDACFEGVLGSDPVEVPCP